MPYRQPAYRPSHSCLSLLEGERSDNLTTNRLENYLALLAIRRTSGRRDTTILGGTFAVSFIATIALGLLNQLSGRSLYLVTALVVIFGLASFTSGYILCSRLECHSTHVDGPAG
jgi:hypothetical protein